MKRLFSALVLLALIFGVETTFADVLVRPALSYTINEEGSGSTTKTTRQLIDLAAGYMWPSGLNLIGMYGMETRKTDSSGSSTTGNRSSLGAGLGWTSPQNGPYVDLVYFLQSEYAIGSSTYKGTGIQFDLGYQFSVSSVGIGLQLTYRTFSYNKLNGQSESPAHKMNNLDPMFALVFQF